MTAKFVAAIDTNDTPAFNTGRTWSRGIGDAQRHATPADAIRAAVRAHGSNADIYAVKVTR